MSEEEFLAVIKRHPEVIVEALEKKPNALTNLMLKLAPWDRFATKEDIKMLLEFMEKRFNAIDKRFEELKSYSDKRFEDINKRFEDLRSYSDKRFEDINKRFEDINRRFEDVNRRFEDMNKRFEDLTRYVDKRIGLVEKLLIGFNIPILAAVITILIRVFLLGL
ncbi:hypothetical protein KEJ50_06985 [Candidatus Bathyarchaeota archaeon]|nr:hypothetical protein [Candidatus Bathyarchaeota archaeon]